MLLLVGELEIESPWLVDPGRRNLRSHDIYEGFLCLVQLVGDRLAEYVLVQRYDCECEAIMRTISKHRLNSRLVSLLELHNRSGCKS